MLQNISPVKANTYFEQALLTVGSASAFRQTNIINDELLFSGKVVCKSVSLCEDTSYIQQSGVW